LGVKTPSFLRKVLQFARVFQEKNSKTPPKFSRSYKNISKPLPRKISEYAPASALMNQASFNQIFDQVLLKI